MVSRRRPTCAPSTAAALLALAAAVTLRPLQIEGQERELHWRTVAVDARLDSTGTLHVRERQVMVFTGDWNGGERRFDVRRGQRFEFGRLARIDASTGAERPLRQGDLSSVDEYSWLGNRTLRWRSRRVSDPLFNQTALTYVLEYTYGRILVPRDSGYLLDHDFAFSDRAGDIQEFTLNLTLDPPWRPVQSFPGTYRTTGLPPGEGFVVSVPLHYAAAGRPGGVVFGATVMQRAALFLVFVITAAWLGVALWRRERDLGRFLPPLSPDAITDDWLQQHVFTLLPEAVGAAWDSTTAAPEVAAVLARLVAEKKLESEVENQGWGIFRRPVMRLRLLVDRSEFTGHERSLVDGLFMPGSKVTDTDAVRKRYATSGFDPASKIRAPIENIIRSAVGRESGEDKPRPWLTLALLGLAVVLLVSGVSSNPKDTVVAIGGVVAGVAVLVFAAANAYAWRSRVYRPGAHALRFVVPLALLAVALLVVLSGGSLRTGVAVLAGLTALALAIVNVVLNAARSRESRERIAMRQRLCAARDWFRRELQREQPRLRDDWYPYLIAFGLGPHVDRWFRAFGGSAVGSTTSSHGSGSFGSSSGSSSSGSSWTGMGGGGGFSGGGSSGSWAAAAGVMAAGVSRPSSGSSGGGGGGGGGGGSSGGGGGGGW
jgi:uncharacterized membrane protein YgcG